MSSEQKDHTIREFFLAPRPLVDPKAIIVGASLALLGAIIAIEGSAQVGLVVLGIGVVWSLVMPLGKKTKIGEPDNEVQYFSVARFGAAKARYEARPSYEEMLSWLGEGVTRVEKESAEHLGLSETTKDPVPVLGPLYFDNVDGIRPEEVLRRKVGDAYFYSAYRLTVFQFTDQFLGSYQANYSMIRDVTTSEQTEEFFYRDVVSVKTHTESSNYTLKTGEKLEHSKMFALAVSSGDRIAVVIDDPHIKVTPDLGSQGDQAIANIRAMLRQYKTLQQTA